MCSNRASRIRDVPFEFTEHAAMRKMEETQTVQIKPLLTVKHSNPHPLHQKYKLSLNTPQVQTQVQVRKTMVRTAPCSSEAFTWTPAGPDDEAARRSSPWSSPCCTADTSVCPLDTWNTKKITSRFSCNTTCSGFLEPNTQLLPWVKNCSNYGNSAAVSSFFTCKTPTNNSVLLSQDKIII